MIKTYNKLVNLVNKVIDKLDEESLGDVAARLEKDQEDAKALVKATKNIDIDAIVEARKIAKMFRDNDPDKAYSLLQKHLQKQEQAKTTVADANKQDLS